jgi:DNA primase
VKLVRRGRSWIGLCPFHKEKSPSFHVTPERGVFHCFGCSEHGSAIDFVMKTEGVGFPDAVRSLAERAGIELEENSTPEERREEMAQRKARDDLFRVNDLAAAYFEQMLREHPHARLARDELGKRGLVSQAPLDPIANALQAFRLGYAPSGWDGLAGHLRGAGVSPLAAEKVGLLLARNGSSGHYDRFRHRLMFAILDLQGRVVGFSGRILPDPEHGKIDKEAGKYVNSPESPIYKKGETVFGLYQARQSVRQSEQAVVVEGNFDVVSLHARGIQNVVAPLGTAFTGEQAALIKRFCPEVVLLFDGDAAGRKAIRASREPCRKAGLHVRAATLPEGKDPDDIVRERGPEGIKGVLGASRGLLEYLIAATLDENFARAGAEDRAARVQEVIELLRAEDDPTVRAMAQRFADDIAGRLASSELGQFDIRTFEALSRAVRGALATPTNHGPHGEQEGYDDHGPNGNRPSGSAPPAAPRDLVTEALLGALLDYPHLIADDEVMQCFDYLNGEAVFVVTALQEATDPGDFRLDAAEFLAHVPPSVHAFCRARLAAPVHQHDETARSELLANAEKLRRRALSREKATAERESAKAEARGEEEESFSLLREAQEAARKKQEMRKGR